MTHADAKARIQKLREEIDRLRYEYHVLNALSISEGALDSLKHELFTLEEAYPDLITPDSPTQRVAGKPLEGFVKVPHQVPMRSLEDVFSLEEAKAWLIRIKKLTSTADIAFDVEVKMDGLALSLVYQDGLLVQAATRGDGFVGEDVTHNARTIESLPMRLRIPTEKEVKAFIKKYQSSIDATTFERFITRQQGRIEIRGEVYMTRKNFESLNKLMVARGDAPLANPRNGSAGAIRQLDPKIAAERKLSFCRWQMLAEAGLTTYEQEHEAMSLLGIPGSGLVRICQSLEEVEVFMQEIGQKREKLPFQIDGIVVKINNTELFESLGVVGKTPRGAVAWKYAAEQGTTIVREIQISVGRTGALTPVAIMDPVQLAGTTVTRASLHNEDEIQRLDVRLGDTVIVEKAGDIIPKVIQVLPNLRTGKEKKFRMPTHCPICGSAVERREGEVATVCTNRACFAQELARLLHFVSRAALDIRGLGDKIVEQLLQSGLVHEPADFYELSAGDFLGLEGFAELSANKLVKEIQTHTHVRLDRLMYALGIRHVGAQTARDLAQAFGSMKAFLETTQEALFTIEGIGDVVAEAILAFLNDPQERERLDHLLEKIEVESVELPKTDLPFSGTSWVITGTLEALSREQAKERIEALGGRVVESVSKKTSFVVVGADPGSKFQKAQQLDIPILDEAAFLEKVK
ncbi:NAD-dependent DNA ligase LigA [Patescibacteria group bacterium]|nr:NAD-dependent DNA ligase LigA [Patescibacteria group bacterium]